MQNLIDAFDDTLNDEVFKSISFSSALMQIKDSKNNLKFLIGASGSGKSFLLNYYHKLNPDTILLQGLVTKENIDKNLDENKLIMIDEAQLLDEKVLEYIRMLSDSKKYTFLLSTHSEDGLKILEKPHFKNRFIDVIEIKPLSKAEMIQYINTKLLNNSANYLISKKEFNKIYNYTSGNFRFIKKFLKTSFELLQTAKENNLKYTKIDNCILTMSAIKSGLENG